MNEENMNIAQRPDFEIGGGAENPVAETLDQTADSRQTSADGAPDAASTAGPEQGSAPVPPRKDTAKKRKVNFIAIMRGDLLKGIRPYLPFLLFILVLGVIMVTYRYKVEEISIKTKMLQEEIEELRIRQIQTKCDYMNATMVNEVARKLEPTGIKEGRTPSNKITINK